MNNKNALKTRTEKCCPQCGQEFILSEPTDVLATRPILVDLLCPDCHFPGRAMLTEANRFLSVFPSPDATTPVGIALEDTGWLTADAFAPLPSFRRPPVIAHEREHEPPVFVN